MKKAKKFHNGPVVLTNFLFNQLVDAVTNLITCNPNVTTLMLEGLPLQDGYIGNIAKVMFLDYCFAHANLFIISFLVLFGFYSKLVDYIFGFFFLLSRDLS